MRNFVHHKYNVHQKFDLKEYANYIGVLKNNGFTEIEHAGSNLVYDSQFERLKRVVEIIKSMGLTSIFYTGVFGTENVSKNSSYKDYAQRDKNGDILYYGGGRSKAAMMCPASEYVRSVTIPKLHGIVSSTDIDGIFIDIPWIIKGGCYCDNCLKFRKDGKNNAYIVRNALQQVIKTVKEVDSNCTVSVNAGAPTIYNHFYNGAHITNLKKLFDEYVTEWNPYRWNQKAGVVKEIISYAKKEVKKRVLHATTATNRKGEMYSFDEYVDLFSNIHSAGAVPRLGVSFSKNQLEILGAAWEKAKSWNSPTP